MKNVNIETALQFVGKVINFDETQDNLDIYSYTGKVLSAIIEHDGKHKLCVEIAPDDAHVFDIDQMHNIEMFRIQETKIIPL